MIEQHPIKLLHVITDLNVGGAEISLYRLLTCLDRTRYASQVVSLIPAGELGDRIRELGIPVFSLNMKPGQPSLSALHSLLLRMRTGRFDIVQSWLYHADLLGLLVARAANIDHVVWNIRNAYLDMSDYRRLSRVVLKGCSLLSGWPQVVICNSRAGQEFHTGLGYHPRRWLIIPNGFDPDEFNPNQQARLDIRHELDLAPNALLVGMTARFDPVKGHVEFLKAAGALVRSGIDAHFIMIGQWSYLGKRNTLIDHRAGDLGDGSTCSVGARICHGFTLH
jgi:glycosyltransferase involved in cell wall biosynthesis